MNCEILVSVMNQKNENRVVRRLGISEKDRCAIINQVADIDEVESDIVFGSHRFFSYREKGLSRSRNHALKKASGDICILSDDDMTFVPDYRNIILRAYEKRSDADIISFDFLQSDGSRETMRKGRVGYIRSMKLSSAQITFKRTSIKKMCVKFDENFGTGSDKYNWGEENIFLFDCLRAGLKIYHVPIVTVVKSDLGSTWDKSSSREHFEQQGAIYYRMSPRWWRVLNLQFVLRKRKIYNKDMTGFQVLRAMNAGVKKYMEGRKND